MKDKFPQRWLRPPLITALLVVMKFLLPTQDASILRPIPAITKSCSLIEWGTWLIRSNDPRWRLFYRTAQRNFRFWKPGHDNFSDGCQQYSQEGVIKNEEDTETWLTIGFISRRGQSFLLFPENILWIADTRFNWTETKLRSRRGRGGD